MIDPRIVTEYREVLLRPRFRLDPGQVQPLLDVFEDTALQVTAIPWPSALEDASDEIFLATARAGSAVLVTGNLVHFPAPKRHGVVVQSPRECLEGLRR